MTNKNFIKYIYNFGLVLLLSILTINTYSANEIYSTNQGGLFILPGETLFYCLGDADDLLYASTPGNKTFGGVATDLGSIDPATGSLPVSTLAVGTYVVTYNGKTYNIEITNPPAVVFDPLPSTCETAGQIDLTTYVDVAGGVFSGTGVTGDFFDPSVALAGTHVIDYTYPPTGCTTTESEAIIVTAAPVASFTLPAGQADVCEIDAAYALSGGSGAPGGGTGDYSGPGVNGLDEFDPTVVVPGNHTITYTYTLNGCFDATTDVITVHSTPTAKTVVITEYCTGGPLGSLTIQSVDVGVNYEVYDALLNLVGSQSSAVAGANLVFSLNIGTYSIVAKDQVATTCETNFGNFTISQYDPPTVVPTAADADFCIGGTTALDAGATAAVGSSITNYSWDNAAFLTSSVIVNPNTLATLPAGNTTFTVTVTDDKGCSTAAGVVITVYALPLVTVNVPASYEEVCIDEASFALAGGLPGGGDYYIDGVLNANFDPAVEGLLPSPHTIQYEYTDGNGCTNTATDATGIIVHDLPVIAINNLDAVHCDSDPIDNFDAIPLVVAPGIPGEKGVFSGLTSGLTDNGDGTAIYDPANTGLGPFTVTYTFTDVNGCTNSASQNTRTGTELFFVDLNATYCDDVVNFTFQYTPGATLNPGDGVTVLPATAAFTDNGDGTADFNPNAAGAGTYVFTYIYTDVWGCINQLDKTVEVRPVPTATIGGLNSSYCSTDGVDNITGSPAPVGGATGVFTFLVAGLTDNGNGTATLNPTLVPVAGSPHNLTYKYTDVFGCADVSAVEQVVINQAPSATISGTTTICEGDTPDLTFKFNKSSTYTIVFSDGTNSTSHQFAPADLNGAFEGIYTLNPGTTINATYTLVSVTDDVSGCSGTTAGSAVISVTPAVNITTQPQNRVDCPGDNISFNVVSAGVNLSYQWQFDVDPPGGGFANVGLNSASYGINNINSGHAGTYRVTVSSATCGGPEVSNEVTLSVGTTTAISDQPNDETACDGATAIFGVVASGDNLTYEWRVGGVAVNPIADPNYVGENTSILTINNLDNTYDGNVYTCFVSGDCGDITSNPATLTVDDPIVITSQPTNKTACPNSNVSYTVAATGTSLNFQWQEDNAGGGVFADMVGMVGITMVLNNVGAAEAANMYRCKITSPCGETVYSDEVSLSLYTPINITNQPDDITVCETQPVNFQVTSDGSTLTYQWQFDGGGGYVNLGNGPHVSGSGSTVAGAFGTALTITGTSITDDGLYRCVITGPCGFTNSDAADLIVDQAVVIINEPDDIEGCNLDDISFTVGATGTNLTYQWQFDNGGGFINLANGGTISGAANSTLLIDDIVALNAGAYRCQVSNGCGSSPSSSATLTLNAATAINAAFPTDKSKCEGETANFTVDITAGTITSIQWQYDDLSGPGYANLTLGAHISGSGSTVSDPTLSSISISNLGVADAGLYRCVITGICGNITSNAATLDVDEPVVISVNPTDKMACETDDVSYSVTATGTAPLYQWYEENGAAPDAAIGGAVNAILVLPAVAAANEDNYYCIVTNSCNSETSASANLTLYVPVTIDSDPVSIARCEGGDAAFTITVDATSNVSSYQWLQDGNLLVDGLNVNGATISGANTNSLLIQDVTTGEDGVYTCDVTGPCNLESRSATLTVRELVVINSNPTSKLVCPGTNPTFTVNATGGVTAYQWQYDNLGGGGFVNLANVAPYSTVTTPTLNITGVAAAQAGVYRCEITGSCIGDVVYSSSANLTVGITTVITDQPVDITGCEDDDIAFTVLADGTNLTYEWYKNPAVLQADGGDISGATTNTLAIDNIDVSDAGVYYAIVRGTCGNVTSGNPTLTVNQGLTINSNPTSKNICEGTNTSYFVNVSGDITDYLWEYNDGSGFVAVDDGFGNHISGSGSTVAGALSNTLFINAVAVGDDGTYRCVITGACETQNSNPAGLTVETDVVISANPTDANKCETDFIDFSVTAIGSVTSYEWYRASQVPAIVNGGDISGATTNTLTISNLDVSDADVYNVIVRGFCADATSIGANLNMFQYLTVNDQPDNQLACPGGAVSFNFDVSGDITSYAWYKDGVLLVNGIQGNGTTVVSGEDTPTLTISNLVDGDDDGDYTCEVVGSCETITSNAGNLDLGIVTTATDPSNVSDCQGETVILDVLPVAGSNLTYQWYKNGLAIANGATGNGSTYAGANNSTLSITGAVPADNGSYHCVVDGRCTDIITNTATLTITPTTMVTLDPTDQSVADGGIATFTIVAQGNLAAYKWYKDGAVINNGPTGNGSTYANTDTPTLTINGATSGDEGDYLCLVTGGGLLCGNDQSNTATLTILLATVVTTQPAIATTKCENEDLSLIIVTTGGPHTYQWQFNNGSGYVNLVNGAQAHGSTVSGATTVNLNITTIKPEDDGFYRCVINGGPDQSNSAQLIVIEAITISAHPSDKERCVGQPVTFTISASGGINQYQWWFDDGIAPPVAVGGNLSSYTIAVVAVANEGTYYCEIDALGGCADVTSSTAALTVNEATVLNSGPVDELLCEGASTSLTADVSGSNLTYQWYFNAVALVDGGSISGSDLSTLDISNALTTDEGSYFCEIQGSCGNETTVPVTITVDPATTITTHPTSKSRCVGDLVQFNVVAEGDALTYAWFHDGAPLADGSMGAATVAGSATASLSISNLTVNEDGAYYCEITSGNSCGDITSNSATLTMFENTVLNNSPVDDNICEGSTITLTAEVSGGNLVYQWYQNGNPLADIGNITGSATRDLQLDNVNLGNNGIYTCAVNGFCGAPVTTVAANITIDPGTSVTVQPIGANTCVGDNKFFSVTADGLDLNYQWRFNDGSGGGFVALANGIQGSGATVAGAAAASLSITGLTTFEDGTYYCEITSNNSCGDVNSNQAELVVGEITNITSSPTNRTICQGANTTFTVAADGDNLTYTWIKDGTTTMANGGNISGATTANLVITGALLTDAGTYTCVVAGDCGTQTSAGAVLTVNRTTVVTSHPANDTICEGDSKTFYVTADGTNLTYQWYFNGVDISTLGDPVYSNDNTSALTITGAVAGTHNGNYHCVVSGYCTNKNSNAATLTIYENTVITAEPAVTTTICENTTGIISLTATGSNVNYQWQLDGVDINDVGSYSGTTTDELTITDALLSDAGIYTCVVSGECGSNVISDVANLVVNEEITIATQPVSQAIDAGNNINLSVFATGTAPNYQWRKDGVNVTNPTATGANATGITSKDLTITAATDLGGGITDAGAYRCVVTGTCNTVNSQAANITIYQPTVITDDPDDVTVCVGDPASMSVTATGTNLTYQWYKNGLIVNDGGTISGVKTSTLSISSVVAGDAGAYDCYVEGSSIGTKSDRSATATITVNNTVSITSHPSDKVKCEGDNVVFTITATGSPTYAWYHGTNLLSDIAGQISGSGTNTITISNLTTAEAGLYKCVVTGACGSVASNTASLDVNASTVINTQPVATTICQGASTTISVAASGDDLVYQWRKNTNVISDGGSISGTNTNALVISNALLSDAGSYSCRVIGACGSVNTNAVQLTVTPTAKITTQPVSDSLCDGNSITFRVNNNTSYTYQWSFNNAPIAGATAYEYAIASASQANAGDYTCYITHAICGNDLSDAASLYVYPAGGITTEPVDVVACKQEPVSLYMEGEGPGIQYQWVKDYTVSVANGINISGSNTNELNFSKVTAFDAGLYRCDITTTCGNNSTQTIELNVIDSTTITQHPNNQSVIIGNTANFTVQATDSILGYQWLKNGLAIGGATSPTYNIPSVALSDAGLYSCRVYGLCGNIISNAATLTINIPVVINSGTPDTAVCELITTQLRVNASGAVSYRWQFKGSDLDNVGSISGAFDSILTIGSANALNDGLYTCVVTGNYDIKMHNVKLTVNTRIRIDKQPRDTTVCEGEDPFFLLKASGSGISYLWYRDSIALDNTSNYTGAFGDLLGVSIANAGNEGFYQCIVTGTCNTEDSYQVNLNLNLNPGTPGLISGDTIVCQGQTNVQYVVPAIVDASTYVWDLPYGATIISGLGTRNILVDYATDAQSGDVSVYGQNSCGDGVKSANLGIIVNTLPLAYAGADTLVCGSSTTMAANSVAGEWSMFGVGDAVISNPSLFNTAVNFLKKGENKFVWTITQNGCVMRDTVTISNTTIDVNAGEDRVICSKTTNLQAITPSTGASWKILSGSSGIIANPSSANSAVSSLSQGVNQFAWVINNQGCESADTVNITNDLPMLPDAGIDQVIDFDVTTLDAIVPELGTNGTWSVESGSGTFVDVNDPKTQVSNLLPGQNILLWSVQRNNCKLADTVIIENIAIEDPEAGPNQTICLSTTKLAAVNPEIGIGEWSVISGAATFVNINSATTQVTNLGNGINKLKWTVRTSGLGIESDSVIITNNQASTANAGADVVLCTNTFTLNANTPQYGTGAWILTSGSGSITDLTNPNSALLDLGQGVNELKWTITNENCTSDDFVKITNNTPTTANAGEDQTLCYDSTVLLPNTPSIGVGSWNIFSGSGTFDGNTVTKLAPDQNTLRYTITQGTCKSVDDVIVTNNMPTMSDAGYDQNICTNTLVLGANQALQGEGFWSTISGAGMFSDTSSNNATVSNISNGINIYRWTITKNNCEVYDEIRVTNNYIESKAGTDVAICSSEYQLLASNPSPGTGIWSVVGSSGAIFNNQNNPNTTVTNLSNGANELKWTVNNNGCVATDNVVITNSNPTTANAGENKSVCGKEVALNANTDEYGDGIWLVMSGAGNFDDPFDPNTTIRDLGEGKNILRWMISEGKCESYDEVQVISNLPENVFAGNNQIACSDTVVLSANKPTLGIGQWKIISGAGTFDDSKVYNTTMRNLSKGENILQWRVSSSDCHVIDTVIITSNIPTKSVAGADQILCKNNTIMAGNTPLQGEGIGQWELVAGSAVIESPNSPNSKVTDIQLGETILSWAITNKGCTSSSELTLINNQPSQPFAGYDIEICADSVRLFATPVEIGKGRWTLVSGDGVVITPDSNQTQVQKIKFNENTFRWTVTNINCVLTDDIVVTNNYEYVNAGVDRQVNTPSVQLVANNPAKGIGQWQVSASPAFIESVDNFETMVTGLGSGANVFTWTITNNGCTSTDDIIVNYVVMPVADFDPSSVKGCPPMLVNFINTSIGGEPYTWDFGDGEPSDDHSPEHVYTAPGVYKAVLTATAPLGLSVTKDTFITVYESPTAKFEIAPDTIYIPGEHISCFNYSLDAEINQWFFGDGTYITEYAPIYSYTDEGSYNITLKVTSKEGCIDSLTLYDVVKVLPRSDFFFPEAFTPNLSGGSGGIYNSKDGSNDVFYPIIIVGELDEYEMIIYNRLGVILFQTNDVAIGWDGYYRNKMQPQDVYVYMVQGRYNNGQPFKILGNVLLIVKEN